MNSYTAKLVCRSSDKIPSASEYNITLSMMAEHARPYKMLAGSADSLWNAPPTTPRDEASLGGSPEPFGSRELACILGARVGHGQTPVHI